MWKHGTEIYQGDIMGLKLRGAFALLAVVAVCASFGCEKKVKPEKTGSDTPAQAPVNTTDSK